MKRVRWIAGAVVGLAMGIFVVGTVSAAEHGGQEHAGNEHGGVTTPSAPSIAPAASDTAPQAPVVPPTAEQVRQTIQTYVQDTSQDEGAFYVDDEVTGEARELTLDHVHDRVGKTGDYYYSCADMKDVKTSDLVDVDFDVEAYDGGLEVVDVRIHKVNGTPRYTYDDKDNRVPVTQ